jgi:hypothetical protein
MNTQSQSVNVPQDTRTMRDDVHTNNPRTIRDLRHRDVFVIDAKPTR